MTDIYVWGLLIVGILVFVSSLDDLVVDVLAFLKGRKPQAFSKQEPGGPAPPAPKIAVFIANWHEADVLRDMVEKNLAAISYRPLLLVLGVYPNDPETLQVAQHLADSYPDQVEVVVNRRNGPTSKGQMLNEMFGKLFIRPDAAPELVILHDSEDVIDPRSFELYVECAADAALIQIPVFSLDSRRRSIVGTTYMEEFAERHSREMVVRSALHSFVPSAGVGTAIRKDLIVHFLRERGHVLEPGSVTEDYILGVLAHRAGYRTAFAFARQPSSSGVPTVVATYEYFPKRFRASVRQKARWVYGIAFDGTSRLGWSGPVRDRFFLYRDRKGAITNLLPALSLALLLAGAVLGSLEGVLASPATGLLAGILLANTSAIAVRLYFRVAALRDIYGIYDVGGVLLRWPLSIVINALATARAWATFVGESGFASRPIAWVKTQHELPARFEPAVSLAYRDALPWRFTAARSVSSSLSMVMVLLLGGYVTALLYLDPFTQEKGTPTLASVMEMEVGTPTERAGSNAESSETADGDATTTADTTTPPGADEQVSPEQRDVASGEVTPLEIQPTSSTTVASVPHEPADPQQPSVAHSGPHETSRQDASPGAADDRAPDQVLQRSPGPPAPASPQRHVQAQSDVDAAVADEKLARSLAERALAAGAAHDRAVLNLSELRARQPGAGAREMPTSTAKFVPAGAKSKGPKKARRPEPRRSQSVAEARPPMRLNWGGR